MIFLKYAKKVTYMSLFNLCPITDALDHCHTWHAPACQLDENENEIVVIQNINLDHERNSCHKTSNPHA